MTEHDAAYYDRQNADRTTGNRPEAFIHPPVGHLHDTDSAETGWCSGCGRSDLAIRHAPGCPEPAGGDCDEGLTQVWCDKCDKPGTVAIPLTDGTRAFRCSQHAWLLIAPNGGKS